MALFTQVLTPGRTVATYNLHLESKGGDEIRYSQLQELLREVNHHIPGMPVLAAGDFNFALSRGEAAAALANVGIVNPFALFQEATTPSHLFSARDRVIDCILLRGPFIATSAQVHSSVVASDHYPLSLTVSFCDCRVVEHRVIQRLHV